jgi:hypothetical protein
VAGLVTAAKESLMTFLSFYNANNTAIGVLATKFEQCHQCAVAVYGCMKSCYRDNKGFGTSIRRLPKKDFNPSTTYLRMNAMIDLWGKLPNLPSTNAPFTAGALTKTQFADLAAELDAKIRAVRSADTDVTQDLKRFNEQNETWDRFVSAALQQGRIPIDPATQLPGPAQIGVAESQAEGAVHLKFSAEHATTFKVIHKGPGQTEFAEVADVLLPGEYVQLGLPGGWHEYKIVGVNSRGAGPESNSVSLQVAEAQAA